MKGKKQVTKKAQVEQSLPEMLETKDFCICTDITRYLGSVPKSKQEIPLCFIHSFYTA
jgi:hypothetical protein